MSSILFSSLIGKINPSFTLEMTAKAAALRAQGVDVINFGVGEPDYRGHVAKVLSYDPIIGSWD